MYPHSYFLSSRPAPFKFFPRPGAALSITFGKPVPSQDIQDTLSTLVRERRMPEAPEPLSAAGGLADPTRPQQEEHSGDVAQHGWLGPSIIQAVDDEADLGRAHEVARVRSAVTAVIQREVEALGRDVMSLRK